SFLAQISEREEFESIDTFLINGVNVFRTLRFELRTKYLAKNSGFKNKTITRKPILIRIVKNDFSSFRSLFKLYFFGKKAECVYMAFPRLCKINEIYLYKFTDPIIDKVEK